jgi:hypothetical protein
VIWLLVLLLPVALIAAGPLFSWLERRADERDRRTWSALQRGERW